MVCEQGRRGFLRLLGPGSCKTMTKDVDAAVESLAFVSDALMKFRFSISISGDCETLRSAARVATSAPCRGRDRELPRLSVARFFLDSPQGHLGVIAAIAFFENG